MQKLEEKLLMRSRKGLVAQTVLVVISAATAIFIGIWVISLVINSISQSGWSATANTTYIQVQTIMWSSIQLLAIGLIVMSASVIFAYFGFGQGRRQ